MDVADAVSSSTHDAPRAISLLERLTALKNTKAHRARSG
ncbi:hypothetical protein ACVIM9_008165 [Bradyrhizobium sp. USDA 4520]